jgi:hypothetical protein
VVAGNVTLDRTPEGGWRPGGPSLYSARMAQALGADVTLITRLSPSYDRSPLAGIAVRALPAGDVSRYANSYDAAGNRTQLLLEAGEAISSQDITLPKKTNAFLLAPSYHEFEGLPPVAAPVIGVSLQGPLRTVDAGGQIRAEPDPVRCIEPFIAPGVYAFFSEEDTGDPEALAGAIAERGATALLTRGYRGATLVTRDGRRRLEAIRAKVVDPTGAGDSFATAFVVRLAETGDLEEACRFALAAGALTVEGPGLAGIPSRARVEERLREEAA